MLLRLTPNGPQPTIVFTLSFGALPGNLPVPQSWVHEMNRLAADDLELPGPQSLLSLDKSTGLMNVLQEVTFDLPELQAACLFVDGHRVEWMLNSECLAWLEDILADVEEASIEAERERREAEARIISAPPPTSGARPSKHKKQRSLLMSLVA
jgi:hypothetical protein